MKALVPATVASLVLLLAACGSGGGSDDPSGSAVRRTPTPTPTPSAERAATPVPLNLPKQTINGTVVTLPVDVKIATSQESGVWTIFINESWVSYTGDGELWDAYTEVGDEDELRPIFEALDAVDAMEPVRCALPGRDPNADCPRSLLFMIPDPGPPPTWTLNDTVVTFPDDVWISGPNPRTEAITIEGGSSWVKLGSHDGRSVLLDFRMSPADEWWVQPLLDVLDRA